MNNNQVNKDYISRINKAIDYIISNLDKELTLEQISSIANFSVFHFHRIFKSITNETLYKFIFRLRMEKAASLLISHPGKSVFEVALDCGFSTPSSFAKAFKDYYGLSATDWKNDNLPSKSKIGQLDSNFDKLDSNIYKVYPNSPSYFCFELINDSNKFIWRNNMNSTNELQTTIEVKKLEEMNVAYIRHIGPYAGDGQLFEKLFGKLFMWAGPRGLIQFPETKSMTIYHNDPEITEDEKLMISVCITVPEGTKTEGEIGTMKIPAGDYAMAYFELHPHQYGEAWQMVYGKWLPQSGYQPDDRPCFELYLNNPKDHPEGKHIVMICAPAKPL